MNAQVHAVHEQHHEEQAAPQAEAPASGKRKTEYETVRMTDGREQKFPGKQRLKKDYTVDHEKGTVTCVFDFRNGETRTYVPSDEMLLTLAGHGAIQKLGDEIADPKLVKIEDAILAFDDLLERLNAGKWGVEREPGDSMSGASVVIRALVEYTGKTADTIKAHLQKKLDEAKDKGEKLTRQDLYASFRRPGTPVGDIIARMESEKAPKVSTDSILEGLGD